MQLKIPMGEDTQVQSAGGMTLRQPGSDGDDRPLSLSLWLYFLLRFFVPLLLSFSLFFYLGFYLHSQ